MTATLPTSCDVAVVGAGPTGLAAALSLQKRGLHVVVLEAKEKPLQSSRATVIHSRTLEVLESVDITADLLQQCHVTDKLQICETQQALATLDFATLNAKYRCIAMIPQRDTEFFLSSKYESRSGHIFRGTTVKSFTQPEGATDTLLFLSTQNGESQTLRAKYIVAADGLHSPIREACSIPFQGGSYNLPLLTSELRLKCSDLAILDPAIVRVYMTPQGLVLLVPQPAGTWRIYTSFADATPKNIDKDLYQSVLDTRVGKGIVVEEMLWSAEFHIHHRLAKQYRVGRVFLAGDAAHVHSPAGGQGMNTGIQDGIRLGEILADALQMNEGTKADVETCLEKYEKERRPFAAGIVALTHRMTMFAGLRNPILLALRNFVLRMAGRSTWIMGLMTRRLAQYPQLSA